MANEGIREVQRRLEAAAPSLNRPAGSAQMGQQDDMLAAAIVDIAAHYGQRASITTVTAGLPLVDNRLPLAHLGAAAAQVGLVADIVNLKLASLLDASLPLLVLFHDPATDTTAPRIIWSIDRDSAGSMSGVVLSAPGQANDRARLAVAELPTACDVLAVRLKPAAGDDDRQSDLASDRPEKWLWPAFRSSRRIYTEAIAATLAINLLALTMPLFVMNVYDRVLPNAAAETLWALAIGVLLATVFDLVIKILRSRYVDIASRRADVVLANLICARLLGARLSDRPVSTGIRANTLREFETLRDFFNSVTLTAFGDLPFMLLFIGMIAVIAGPLALIPLAGIPLVVAMAWLTQRSLGRLTEMSFRESGQKSAVAIEILVGLENIKAARAENWAARNWEKAVAEHVRTGNQIRHVSNLGQMTIQATQTIIQIVMVIVGFYMLVGGALTMGALIASTMLAGRAVQPLSQMAALITRIYQARIAYRSLSDIISAPQERPKGARLIDKAACAGAIRFDAVTFRYDKDVPPALHDVSFSLEAGEKVAVVGGIGTGKSTLLHLIHAMRMPDSGRILIDGVPTSQIDPASLRHHVGMALQNAEIFHGTIRSNIVLANPAASDAALLAAAETSGALEWIMRQPKGFETQVRERGANLSGGQRQSIVLARTFLAAPRILLLDEPTSDMDPRTEQQVVSRLRAGMGDCTLIVVTHRPALLDLVDRIIVLEGGRKILDGPKASVLKSLQLRVSKAASAPVRVAGTPEA